MINQKDGIIRLENEAIAVEIDTARRFSLRAIQNKLTGCYFETNEASPATVVLSAAKQRIPILNWRMNLSSPKRETDHRSEAGYLAGYHRPDVADDDWYEVEFPYGTPHGRVRGTPDRYEGYGWFRQRFDLPAAAISERIAFLLGGYDQHDWNEYWVYLNGQLIGHRLATSYWREPAVIELRPGEPGYGALRFGHSNLLAIQTCNLHRARPDMRDEDSERYLFNSSLTDQVVTIGQPYQRVHEFELVDWASDESAGRTTVRGQLRNRQRHLNLSVHYEIRGNEPAFRKWVEVENAGDSSQLALDLVILDFQTNGKTNLGGRGYPVYLDDQLFAGVEHPAGVNQGLGATVRLWHCPGKRLDLGQTLRSKSVVIGVGEAGQARQAFLEYLLRNGQRKPAPYALWSTEGVHDYPFATTWAEQVVPEDKMLRALDWMDSTQKKYGKLFDYFVLDVGWQDHAADLTKFHQEFWPNGPGKVVSRVNELGMKFGLWFAGTSAGWSCGENPDVKPSFVPLPQKEMPEYKFQPAEGPPGRTWVRGQLCPASEPYRSILRNAILHHIQENEMRLFKIDTSHYVCHSTSHDHLPGKYSTEAMMDETIALTDIAREACPDIFVMWYWGHSSPFWALYGDTIFESGVFMEASNVSTHPSLFYRDSVTTYLDEGTQFANQIPPLAKDSLGVWIGHVQWANWMGKDDWRNAWIADLGRGSLMAQLWGNVFLFDEDDARFLAETMAWWRKNADILNHPRPILGDPWYGQPYGYLHAGPDRAFIFAHNPTFEHQRVQLRLDKSVGLKAGGWKVSRLYPDQAEFAKGGGYANDDLLTWWLRPFEVALLELQPASAETKPVIEQTDPLQPPTNPSRPLAWALSEGEARNGKRRFAGRIDLPEVAEDSTIGLILRFWRDEKPWRSDYICDLIKPTVSIDGNAVSCSVIPGRRVWKSSNWMVVKMDAPAGWSNQSLEVEIAVELPDDVELTREGWLVPQWWTKLEYRSP